jgi:hypothetical protein
MTRPTPNCYVGALAADEQAARQACVEEFYVHPDSLTLVHIAQNEGEEAEEFPGWATYIFSTHADSSEQEEGDWLHDLYDLPALPNMPCEII